MTKGMVTANRPNPAPVMIHAATIALFLHFRDDWICSGELRSVAILAKIWFRTKFVVQGSEILTSLERVGLRAHGVWSSLHDTFWREVF